MAAEDGLFVPFFITFLVVPGASLSGKTPDQARHF
jgi:hypothetical protein